MPNWTTNRVYCKNLKSLIKDGKLLFPKDGNIVDFERLLPMPKSLDISSPVDVDAVVAYLTDDFKLPITEELIRKVHEICFKDNFFVRLDDTRKYVLNAVNNRKPGEMVDLKISFDETSEMLPLRDKGRIYVENHEKYGHVSWYDWACDVWGPSGMPVSHIGSMTIFSNFQVHGLRRSVSSKLLRKNSRIRNSALYGLMKIMAQAADSQ